MLGDAAETGADFAVSSDADAVAMAAKGFGHGSDGTEFAAAIGEDPAFGCGRWVIVRGWAQVKLLSSACKDFVSGHDHFFEPGAGGVERHEFDESQAKVSFASELDERANFMVVQPANND